MSHKGLSEGSRKKNTTSKTISLSSRFIGVLFLLVVAYFYITSTNLSLNAPMTWLFIILVALLSYFLLRKATYED